MSEVTTLNLPGNVLDIAMNILQDIISTGQILQKDIADGVIDKDNLLAHVKESSNCEHWLLVSVLELISEQFMEEHESTEDDTEALTIQDIEELEAEMQGMLSSLKETLSTEQ